MTASFLILVGSWTTFISTLKFTVSPPSLSLVTQSVAGVSPSWIQPSPLNSTIFYATNEDTVGLVVSYVLNKATGVVTPIANVSTAGGSPAHIGFLPGGKELEAVNYSGANALNVQLTDDLLHFKNPTVLPFTGSGPKPNQAAPHPHQAVAYGSELLIPDLGSDKVWRLTRATTGWKISSFVQQPIGSGPRHIVALPGVLYTLHENDNTLTQHTLPTLASGTASSLVASLSIVPTGTNSSLVGAGELLYTAPSSLNSQPLLYASNRNDPHPDGDAIAIFTTTPKLKLLASVRTGLQHLRGVTIGGPDGKYLVAAGLNGGGIKVFERINNGLGLKELANLKSSAITLPTGVVLV